MCLFDVFLQGEGKERGREEREKETEKKERLYPTKTIEGELLSQARRQLQFSSTEFRSACLCCRSLHSAGDQIPAHTELIDG